MGKTIGIDLGTSTSEAAILIDGKPVMIENEQKEVIIPSVIGLDEEGNILVGTTAADQLVLYPERTAIEIKRKMGTQDIISLGNNKLTPVEGSAHILSYIKKYAETFLKEEVDSAVVTVPAYFNDQQRKETMQAGEQAGLKIKRIINEPTAAALCYGIDHMEEENHILIYDFGGGTFDVTLLEMFDGVLEVKASSGNNALGGKDFDERIIRYLLKQFQEKNGIDLESDIYAMVKLKEAASACKIALSSEEQYDIVLPFIISKEKEPISLEETITRVMFEEMIADLVGLTAEPIHVVLEDSKINVNEIDIILLVGGSTRVPYVQQFVEKILGKKAVSAIHPELSVAMGAAVQAAMLSGEISSETGILITDVNPYALGVRILSWDGILPDDDHMDILIPRNVTIPVSKKSVYVTSFDGQQETKVEVYQGEKEKATANNFLGKFILSGIPPAGAGEEKIEVEFSYDTNGILEVSAKIISNGKNAKMIIDVHGTEAVEDIDITKWKDAQGAVKYRSVIRKAEKLLKQDKLEADEKEDLEDDLFELKKALVQGTADEYIQQIEEDILLIMEDYL